jgi:hypothetical protein
MQGAHNFSIKNATKQSKMGTFAETAIVNYRFQLPTKENKLLFSVYI